MNTSSIELVNDIVVKTIISFTNGKTSIQYITAKSYKINYEKNLAEIARLEQEIDLYKPFMSDIEDIIKEQELARQRTKL